MNKKQLPNLSIIFPYYRQPQMLKKQLDIWKTYDKDVEIILVDDGSNENESAENVIKNSDFLPKNFQLFKILIDLPWNHAAARNIGAKYAKSEWIVLMDLDHLLTNEELNKLYSISLSDDTVYDFQRKGFKSGNPKKKHTETRLLKKELYWRVGGYNETFSGAYGLSRQAFVNNLNLLKQDELPITLVLVGHKDICDARCPLEQRKCLLPKNESDSFQNRLHIISWYYLNGRKIQHFRCPWVKII